ncbi:ABC transporter permease [Leucobacter sp. wl10]|uniref:ABC transporter permease n=1 Tax=Leucobacter sp. wl10 TaxID=2304677 RepID=UPI001968CE3D|nr:ABC transporter permease [Leucobacter sp. wl10]
MTAVADQAPAPQRARGSAALWVPAGVAVLFLLLPLIALLIRIEWPRVPEILVSRAALDALALSLLTAGAATVLCVLLGVPLAVQLASMRGWPATLLRGVVMMPLVLPPLVGGMALLMLLGRGGLLGEALLSAGVRIPFTTPAVVLAQVFVALPFLVISVEGALRSADPDLPGVAEGLGARPLTVLRRITLPLVAPALISGAILSFTRALGEFGATAMFAGNAPGRTQTIPLAIYTAFNGAGVGQDTALALALLLICIAFATLLLRLPGAEVRA